MARKRDMLAQAFFSAAGRVDEESVRSLYAAMSVPTERERARLRRAHHVFVDPLIEMPDVRSVARTADRLIEQAAFSLTALGAIAGMGGAASVPPEVVANMVGVVRLAQRLAVVYGFDPERERGAMALRRALSAGLQVDLPEGGPMGLKLSDLPRILAPEAPREVTVAMTRALVRKSAWMVVGSVARFIPFVSAGAGAARARRRTREVGGRMKRALEHIAELPLADAGTVVDAIEV
ncbi:MAG: hypothetical protein ACI9MC_001257 [Kiritimatiellia bacterium]|jgi:hypothetical protein